MTTKERLDKHDRQIEAIRHLIQEGMRLVVITRREMVQFRKDMRELQAAQKKTEASLKAFIDSMQGGGNGHAKGKLDLR